jgi:hypothetical protein
MSDPGQTRANHVRWTMRSITPDADAGIVDMPRSWAGRSRALRVSMGMPVKRDPNGEAKR